MSLQDITDHTRTGLGYREIADETILLLREAPSGERTSDFLHPTLFNTAYTLAEHLDLKNPKQLAGIIRAATQDFYTCNVMTRHYTVRDNGKVYVGLKKEFGGQMKVEFYYETFTADKKPATEEHFPMYNPLSVSIEGNLLDFTVQREIDGEIKEKQKQYRFALEEDGKLYLFHRKEMVTFSRPSNQIV